LLTFRKQREKKGAFLLQGAQASLSAERRFGAKMWLKTSNRVLSSAVFALSRSAGKDARAPSEEFEFVF